MKWAELAFKRFLLLRATGCSEERYRSTVALKNLKNVLTCSDPCTITTSWTWWVSAGFSYDESHRKHTHSNNSLLCANCWNVFITRSKSNLLEGNETCRLTSERVWSGSCWELFPTITAALSLDFSDDAMVKRGVTESVLKEICEWNARFNKKVWGGIMKCNDKVCIHHLFQWASPGAPSLRILPAPGKRNKSSCFTRLRKY